MTMHLVQGPVSTASTPREPLPLEQETLPEIMAPSCEGSLKIMNIM